MNTDNGRLFYATGIDNSQLRADAAESRNILASIGQTAQDEGNRMDTMFGRMAKASAAIFATSRMADFTKKIIDVRGEIESLEISFETLAGKSKGNALFNEIRQFAVSTPMMMNDLAKGAQTMLGFNIEAEKVMPILRAIGDISMGDAQKFNSLTLAFSQMSATGKLMGQDLLQMINAGFNPLAVISEKTGKSIKELKEDMEKGKITVEMVTEAFISATSAGGKYYGMLEKQSKGINGAVSNLQGAIDDLYNSIGESSQGVITGTIDGATYLVKNYEAVAEILGVIVATYGTYKGAVIVNEAMIQSAIVAKDMAVKEAFESEMAMITELLPQKEAEAQTSLQQAVAAGHITEAKASEIAMLRAEAAAQMEALTVTEAAAKARIMASQDDIRVAAQWEEEIQNKIEALEEEADALFDNGDSIAFDAKQEEIAALKSELLAVQKERETAVQEVNTAANEMNAASHQRSAIATAQESAATEINTAQTTTNTGVTSALTIAKTKLIAVTQRLYGAISAHPYAIVAAAVIALSYAVYKMINSGNELKEAQKRLNDSFTACEGSIAAEKIQIDQMFDRLKQAKKGTEEYQAAKDAIIEKYGAYLNGLSTEISTLQDVAGAYDAVTEAATKSARARAMNTFLDEEGEKYKEGYDKQYDKIYDLIKDKMGEEYAEKMRENIAAVLIGKKRWSKEFLSRFDESISVGGGNTGYTSSYVNNKLTNYTTEGLNLGKDYQKLTSDTLKKYGLTLDKEEPDDDGKGKKSEPELWKDKVAATQKELKEAEQKLKDLKKNGKATVKEIENAKNTIDSAKEKLKGLDVDVDKNRKAGEKGADINSQNADMFANEAATRKQQTEAYTRQLAEDAIESEFEIRQARIDAMKDGVEKELLQNQLNYDRLLNENKKREKQMLDDLAEQRIRDMEDANPTVFKKKNSDGKWEENPGKRDEMYREIRAKLTIEDLDSQQKAQIEEFGRIAALAFEQSNKESLDKMLGDVQTYSQQRKKIEEEYAQKREDLYEQETYTDTDGRIKTRAVTDADGNKVFRKGVTQGNLDEVNRQEDEALKAVDEQFASREETYQAWCETIADMSLENLERVLKDAKNKLDELKSNGSQDEGALAQARAKVATAEKAVKKEKAQNQTNPGKRTIKEWEDLYKTLNDVKDTFEEMGDTVGGTVGEIVSECGSMAASALQMINGIVTLANWSAISIKMTAEGASAAIQTMEKASVILTIISAALQIAMQIASLFNKDEDKQEEIENLQNRIDQLQWELDHQDIGRVQQQYGTAISNLNKALMESRLELAAGQRGWQRLITLIGSASDNQKLLQLSSEKLAETYGKMAYTADKALGEKRYQEAEDRLKNLAQQQILMQEQINAEASKKKTDDNAIKEWQEKIEELGHEMLEIINEMVEDIIGDTSTGIAEELADAFFDAFAAGEDAAQAWGDKVNEIVSDILKRMMIQKFLEEPLGELFDKYKAKWFPNGQFSENGIDAIMGSMTEFSTDLNALFANFNAAFSAIPEELKATFKASTSQENTAGMFETMSQDVATELNGRFAALQLSNELIREYSSVIADLSKQIHVRIEASYNLIEEIRNVNLIIIDYLESISRNTHELYEMNERLEKIEKNTKRI